MSDKVKLIIEISEEDYLAFSKLSEKEKVNELSYYERIIANGIPLEDVKAEIDNEWARTHHMYPEYAGGLAQASEIIDKHIGKAESEDKE